MADQPRLSQIPSVDSVLGCPEVERLCDAHGRPRVADAVRAAIDAVRASIQSGQVPTAGREALLRLVVTDVERRAAEALGTRLNPVVNATGIVLHTNLGRSPLPKAASDRLVQVARGYSNLELDLSTGRRGSRHDLVEGLLTELTGAEAAVVVNNNAAAVLLVLNTLALGREAVVSRGQLIEIGGAFRLPDIMARSGVQMVEVGTTNRTHLSDYEAAITERTGLIVAAHTSNYRVLGFTATVGLEALADLGRRRGVPVAHDLGGGVLIDLRPYGLPYEPVVADSVRAGVDAVTFSGDKVLGGPQSGIIAGRREVVDRIRRNPLMRAVRCGKLTYAALEATLGLYTQPERLAREHPALRMLTAGCGVLRRRARRLVQRAAPLAAAGWSFDIVSEPSQAGSGTLPLEEIPSIAVGVRPAGMSAGELAARMRGHRPPVLGYVREAVYYLNMRTVAPDEVRVAADALCAVAGQEA